jgi:hypothetical protein
VNDETLQQTYLQVKKDIRELVKAEWDRMEHTPELRHLLIH